MSFRADGNLYRGCVAAHSFLFFHLSYGNDEIFPKAFDLNINLPTQILSVTVNPGLVPMHGDYRVLVRFHVCHFMLSSELYDFCVGCPKTGKNFKHWKFLSLIINSFYLG